MEHLNFGEIYMRYYKRSFLFVKSYVRDDMVAEDITSEALIRLWETSKTEKVEYPLTLLTTILRNKALNYITHERIKLESMEIISSKQLRDLSYRITSLQACVPEEIFSSEITDIVKKTMESLPEQTREIFMLSRYDQMSVKMISERTGLNSKSVEYHMTKSLKALRLALRDYLPLFYFLFSN